MSPKSVFKKLTKARIQLFSFAVDELMVAGLVGGALAKLAIVAVEMVVSVETVVFVVVVIVVVFVVVVFAVIFVVVVVVVVVVVKDFF